MTYSNHELLFVSCVSRLEVARECLLASPCLGPGGHRLVMHWNCGSAAHAVNSVLDSRPTQRWLVWAHQDVFLPAQWDAQFLSALDHAESQLGPLEVVGLYGLAGSGTGATRAGHVLDRGRLLKESQALPCLVDSLDELLFAVKADTSLRLDPQLKFDFYATDLVLQAQAQGKQCAVVDAFCEHWSDTPYNGEASESLARRIAASGAVFESKWRHRLPVSTPCFDIDKPGDMAAFTHRFLST